jgi:hypothetical protein
MCDLSLVIRNGVRATIREFFDFEGHVLQKIQDWGVALLTFAIGLLVFIGVLLFAWHVEDATPWAAMSAGDWGVWVGSVGTVATLVMTIRLATESSRTQRREQLELALVTTAGMMVRLRNVLRGLAIAQDALSNPLKLPDDVRPTFLACFNKINETVLWNAQELTPMVTLPNQVSARLVWISTNVQTEMAVFKMISDEEESPAWDVIELVARTTTYELNSIIAEIQSAMTDCTNFLLAHGFEQAVPRFNPAHSTLRH